MEIFNNILISPDMSATTMSADTIYLDGKPLTWGPPSSYTPEEITINIEQIVTSPQEIKYIIKNTVHPIERITKVNLVTTKKVITPPVIIKTIINMEAYTRICGSYHPTNVRYVNCMKCVDKYLSENIITSKLQLTRKGCGCNIKNK